MRKRLPEVDALRGAALLGICVVNVPFLALPNAQALTGDWSGIDALAAWTIEWLFQGKFFLLFSFLFGWGAAGALGEPPAPGRHARRLLGLLLIGTLHAALVFHGDILILYAILGAALWPLRRLGARALVRVALATVPVAAILHGLLGWAVHLPLPLGADAHAAGYLGSVGDALGARLVDWGLTLPFIMAFNGPLAFGAFALGLAAARTGFLDGTSRAYERLRAAVPALLPVALLLNAGYAAAQGGLLGAGWLAAGGAALLAPGAPALSACLLVGVVEASRRGRLGRGAEAAGRMSLTAYVAEGVVAGLVFNGYGLGLYGQLGPAALLPTALGIYAAVHLLALAWQRALGQGPLERLLARIVDGPRRPAPRARP